MSHPNINITFECQGCHAKLKVDTARAGRTGRCPKCGHAVQVPQQRAARDATTVLPPPEHGRAAAPVRQEAIAMNQPATHSSAPRRPADTISLSCPSCKLMLVFPSDRAGTEADCPDCGTKVLVREELSARPKAMSSARHSERTGATIQYDCKHCGATLRAPRQWAGQPEYCPNCMNVHLITDKAVAARRKQGTVACEWLQLAYSVFFIFGVLPGVALLVLRKVSGDLPDWVRSLQPVIVVQMVSLIPVASVLSRLRRKWLLDLDASASDSARRAAHDLLGLRQKGQRALLCTRCAGTRIWGWLGRDWKCSTCGGKGYVSYIPNAMVADSIEPVTVVMKEGGSSGPVDFDPARVFTVGGSSHSVRTTLREQRSWAKIVLPSCIVALILLTVLGWTGLGYLVLGMLLVASGVWDCFRGRREQG